MSDRTSIVVDWGSSNFRAYRFGADGEIVARHAAPAGILSVRDGQFEPVLRREIGAWVDGGATTIWLSGMITSRNGWVETPYAPCPATLQDLARQAVSRTLDDGTSLRFLPGVAQVDGAPDVMRGEEIQIFGCAAPAESGLIVLPGTHSKWARVEAGRIVAFRTFLTGEIFALLTQHSIIGRLIPDDGGAFDEAAFGAGVKQALSGSGAGLLADVFTARSGALLGRFPPAEIRDRLSGLVIGHEIAGGMSLDAGSSAASVRIVAEPALAARYRHALGLAGITAAPAGEDCAVEGFRRLMALKGNGA